MVKSVHRTFAQARRSAYNDPVAVAEYMLSTGQPLPLDLQDDLQSLGIMVDEFCHNFMVGRDTSDNIGFSIV